MYGVGVPVSVAITLKVCEPAAGMLDANVIVPSLWPVSELTTTPLLMRLTVKGPVPPERMVLKVTDCPRSITVLLVTGAVTVGAE